MKQYDRYRDTRTGDIWTLLFDEFNRPYVSIRNSVSVYGIMENT